MIIRNPRDLGLLIKHHRKARSWSQKELAEQIGASRYWVIDVEKGKPTAEIGLTLQALTSLGLALDVRAPREMGEHTVTAPQTSGPTLESVLARATGATLDLPGPASPQSPSTEGGDCGLEADPDDRPPAGPE